MLIGGSLRRQKQYIHMTTLDTAKREERVKGWSFRVLSYMFDFPGLWTSSLVNTVLQGITISCFLTFPNFAPVQHLHSLVETWNAGCVQNSSGTYRILESQWVECLLNDKGTDGWKLQEICAMMNVLQFITMICSFPYIEVQGPRAGESLWVQLIELRIMNVCIQMVWPTTQHP